MHEDTGRVQDRLQTMPDALGQPTFHCVRKLAHRLFDLLRTRGGGSEGAPDGTQRLLRLRSHEVPAVYCDQPLHGRRLEQGTPSPEAFFAGPLNPSP